MLEPLTTVQTPNDLKDVLLSLRTDLIWVSWFRCIDLLAVERAQLAIEAVAIRVDGTHCDVQREKTALIKLCSEITHDEFSFDVWQDAFGVSRESLLDSEGITRSARLLAQYYQRPHDLAEASATLMYLARVRPPYSIQLGPTVVGILESPNPLITLRGMNTMRLHLKNLGPAAAKRQLNLFTSRADPSGNSAASFNLISRMINQTHDPRAQATWTLESYRKVTEGQIRSWLWLLLPSSNDSANRIPMLGSLEGRLAKDERPDVRALGRFLRRTWRNAAAHEDVQFNRDDQLLDEMGEVVELDEVKRRISEALAFHSGCEVAMMNYNPELDDEPLALAPRVPRAYQLIRARDWLGDNGLLVDSVQISKGVLSARVEPLTLNQLDPCFQAIVLCKRSGVEFESVEVNTTTGTSPIVVVSKLSVDLTEIVWLRARDFAVRNPGCTFLAMNFENRLRVEKASVAAEAIVWLTLNDAIEAFDVAWDLEEGNAGPNSKALELLQLRYKTDSREMAILTYLLQRLRMTLLSFELVTTLDQESFSVWKADVSGAIAAEISAVDRAIRGSAGSASEAKHLMQLRGRIRRPAPAPTLGVWDWSGID